MLLRAVAYARRGISVFPCEPGGKAPLTYNGFWDATRARLRRLGEQAVDALQRGEARTGGGGVHVFFRYPAGETVRNSAGRLGPGLDVRGEGGYVVVPPSRTQAAYEWLDRTPPANPAWLLGCLGGQSARSGEGTLF